jgi:CxxC motif-containing protein
MGCTLQVEMSGTQVLRVTGNTCKRGDVYARKEVTNPTRIVTTTVRLKGKGVLPVKTKEDIPKEKIMECVKELKDLVIEGPVQIGQIILENAAGTGIPVIATAASEEI